MPILDLPSAHFDSASVLEIPEVVLARIAGEEDLTKLSAIANDVLLNRDIFQTLTVMCTPDQDRVLAINHALAADQALGIVKELREASVEHMVSSDVYVSLAEERDWKRLLDDSMRANGAACMASGYILRWVISRWQRPETRAEASLGSAITKIEEWAQANRVPGVGRQNLKQHIWPKFRAVSHLWAAFYIFEDLGFSFTTPCGFQHFLSTAHSLLRTASTIVPKGRRAGEVFLPMDAAWQIPETHLERLKVGDEDLGVIGSWIGDPDSHDIRKRAGKLKPV